MMTKKLLFTTVAAAGLASALFASPADAQYYKGKTINMLVPVPGGSGLDLMARQFGNSWVKHIPGNPKLVARNMPGGGGVKSLNFLFDKGRPDGLTVNFGAWNAAGVIAKKPGIRFDPQKLGFVGSGHMPQTTIMRTNVNPPMKTSADIVKVKRFKVAGRGADRSIDLAGNLALDLMGLEHNYIYIPGFRGMSKINPAIRRNEVHAGHSGFIGYNRFFKNTLIKSGEALALWYQSDFDASGNPMNNPTVTDIPSFHDVYKKVHGKLPSGAVWDAYKWVRTVSAQMSLTIFTAPGVSDEALAALRKGYYALASDAEFKKSFTKLAGIAMTFTPLQQGLDTIRTFKNISPEIKAVFEEKTQKGGATSKKRGKGKKGK